LRRVCREHAVSIFFAGSGALGLESLSRGAAHVTFVERDAAAARELRARLSEWGASGAEVEHGDALRFLGGAGRPFDIVFLDPPFDSDFLTLQQTGWKTGVAGPRRAHLCRMPSADRPPAPATHLDGHESQAGRRGRVSSAHASIDNEGVAAGMNRRALYPGTFDPITNGHNDSCVGRPACSIT